jgi:hypothetical protein
MRDLDIQLRDYMSTLVEQTTALRGEDIVAAAPRGGRRQPRHRRRVTAVAVAGVIATMIGVAAILLHRSTTSVVTAGPSGTTRTYHDQTNGLSLELPHGWQAVRPTGARRTGLRALVEVRSPGQLKPGPASRCVPSSTHGVSSNLVWIGLSELRYSTPPLPGRPQTFAPQPGVFDPALVALGPIGAAFGCPHPATQILFDFADHQRKFQFQVIAGPEASTAQTYRILDSLQVKTSAQLHRTPSPTASVRTDLVPFVARPRPQDVRVFILNASSQPGIETTTANRLRNLGYMIVGTQMGTTPSKAFTNSSGESLTLASCRPGFSETGAGQLASVGIGTSTVSSDTTVQAFIQSHNTDCLIIIGQANNTTIPTR